MNQHQGAAEDGSFDAFYAASYPRLVRLFTAISGSRSDAEELVQDAFVRLVPRWERVCRYDQPEAWVRQVALRSLVSRHRRWKVALAAQPRLLGQTQEASPSGDRLDIETVLSSLSVAHRSVLVLHYGLGFPLNDVAREVGVPIGTVKSRLARARAAFITAYNEEPCHD